MTRASAVESTIGEARLSEAELADARRRDEMASRSGREDFISGRRMGVDMARLDLNNFEYRFVNDNDIRLHTMTTYQYWNIVTQDGNSVKPDSADLGNAVSIVVGTKKDGSPLRSYLCRKPKRYAIEDRAKKQTELDAQMLNLREGKGADGEPLSDYVPNGGIRIARS